MCCSDPGSIPAAACSICAAVPVGSALSVRARITGNYEHKGHRFVEIDALVLAEERTPVARIAHTAIYRPRQVAAA